ncbi:MAG: hypothetical protein COB53_11790 [Elusimicrobia bacterium]|nr:MAG: hypothetical protein COB53_11790 [Elusimicrobiota bacterium]
MDDVQREDAARAATAAALSSGAGAVPQTGFMMFQAFFGSTPVIASTLTAAVVIAGIGWADMAKRDAVDDSHLAKSSVEAKIRPKKVTYDPRVVEGLPGASHSGPNALEMFRRSNRDSVREDVRRVEADQAIEEAYEQTPEEVAELSASASPPSVEMPKAAALQAMGAGLEGAEEIDENANGKTKGKKKLAKAFQRPQIKGGVGMAGGIGGGFDLKMKAPPAAKAGMVRAMSRDRQRSVKRGKTGVGRGRAGSKLRGATGKKLSRMNRAMGAAAGSGSATTASTHNSQWDGSGNIGSSLSGSGASGNAISGGGQALDNGGLGEGGPINAGGSASAANSADESAPSVGKGKNVTPNQKMIDMAMVLLPIASILLLAAFVMGRNPATQGAAKMLAYGALGVSVAIAALGGIILAKGQAMQGGLLAAVGGALAFVSYTAAEGNADAALGDEIAEQEAIQWAGPDNFPPSNVA